MVERQTGEDLHGRHRLARARRRAGRPGHLLAHGNPHRAARWAVRDHHPVRDHPGGLVQAARQTGVQDGPAPAPFRADGLGRGNHRDPVLDHRRTVRRARHRSLLRRLGDRFVTEDLTPRQEPDWRGPDVEGRAVIPWQGLRVCVVGARVVGLSAARAVRRLGAEVTIIDRYDDETTTERAAPLTAEGIRVRLGDDATLPADCELLLLSPGIPPAAPIVAAGRAAGIPIWGDVELAWRLRKPLPDGSYAPWLPVTGTNGKTTAVRMLAAMLEAAGKRTVACGNVGLPIVDAVTADEPYEVLAVELSSFQLHWTESLSPLAAAVLNIAPDHVDWHGSLDEYARAKGRIYENCQIACVYNVADDTTRKLVEDADVIEGCRAIGFTLGAPGLSMLGVV